ncbi:MAG: SDR family NAD(P)-dependent oxidoreductase [Geodermatophilaceae bacterium]
MGLLSDRVVIVTGAGRGLGRGEALELARRGAAVVLNEYDEQTGQGVVDEIAAQGGQALLVGGDVSEVEVGDRLVETAVSQFGQMDALVNNAGILRDRTLANMTPEEWDAVIRVHLRGHYTVHPRGLRLLEVEQEAGTHRPHLVDLGHPRQLRPGQLRGGQGRHRGVLHDHRAGDDAGTASRPTRSLRPRGPR